MKKLKFPKERVSLKTQQDELPTVRDVVEKINEIVEFIEVNNPVWENYKKYWDKIK